MYLSWSIYQLVIVLVAVTFSIWMIGRINFKDRVLLRTTPKEHYRYLKYSYIGSFILIAFLAIDVGTKQSELNRWKFNAKPNIEEIQRVESTRTTREDVERQFNETVNNQPEVN